MDHAQNANRSMKPAGGLKKTYIDPRDLPEVERATLRRIVSYLWPYRRDAGLVLSAIVVAALLGVQSQSSMTQSTCFDHA